MERKEDGTPFHVPFLPERTAQISNEDVSFTTTHQYALKEAPVVPRHVSYVILQIVSYSSKAGVDLLASKGFLKGINIVPIFIL